MINDYKSLVFYIKADRIMNGYEKSIKSIFFPNLIVSFLKALRWCEYFHNVKQKTIIHNIILLPIHIYYKYMYEKLSYKLGFNIPINCIEYGVFLAHHGSCVINGASKIGPYCCIFNNVTLADGNKKIIGSGCFISSNVVIAKQVSIANGVRIAANAFINKSINEENTLWAGIPSVCKKKYSNKWYENGIFHERYKKIERLKKYYNLQQL